MAKGFREKHSINIPEVQRALINQSYISKNALKDLLVASNPSIDDMQFRNALYTLEKENIIYSSGSAMYTVVKPEDQSSLPKERFVPAVSPTLKDFIDAMDKNFPFLECVYWETRILHDFMVNQPKTSLIIISVEKGFEESVFNSAFNNNSNTVFLSPDKETLERYVSNQIEPIIITKLVSQSPKMQKGKIHHYARIEKILIDLLADVDLFATYQELELTNIYENIFRKYKINEDALLRYAGRRSSKEKLEKFITKKTNIKIREFVERN